MYRSITKRTANYYFGAVIVCGGSVDEFTWIGVTMSGRTINNLRYADDIVLIATSQEALQRLVNKLSTVSREYGLEINTKKTSVGDLNHSNCSSSHM